MVALLGQIVVVSDLWIVEVERQSPSLIDRFPSHRQLLLRRML